MSESALRFDDRPRPGRVRGLSSSLVKIIRDPEETAAGARLVMYFNRDHTEQRFREFREDRVGRAILDGAPSLYDLLTDRDALAAMPEGSVGRTYLEYMIREGISTEALDEEVAPVEVEIHGADPEFRRFQQHGRASHDLWHVLTGYHRDLLGEAQVLTFSASQIGDPAFRFLSRLARFGVGRQVKGARELLSLAAERGAKTRPLHTVEWAPLLPRPIEEVRETLGMGPPPSYIRHVRKPSGFGLVPEEAAS